MNDAKLIEFLEAEGSEQSMLRAERLKHLDRIATAAEPKLPYAKRKLAELRAETVERTRATQEAEGV